MAKEFDVLIIGGGAAGLSAAGYAARAGLSVGILEGMAPGGQLLTIDHIENYPGFDEGVSGFELADKFEKSAINFGAELIYTTVTGISKKSDTFNVDTEEGSFSSKTIIYATGAKHRELGCKGEKEYQGKGVSYCATCDGAFFKNKKIFVSGGGDSACQEALFLAKLSKDVTILHRRDRFRAQQSIVNLVQKNPSIKTLMESQIQSINGDGKKVTGITVENIPTKKVSEITCDAVFIFVGSLPNTNLIKDLDINVDKQGYILTDENMQTNLPGFYATGDVRSTPFRQIVTAASDGSIAAHYAQQYIDSLSDNAYGEFK